MSEESGSQATEKNSPPPILALDVGDARIGLARWTPDRGVQDEGVLSRTSLRGDVERIAYIVAERNVGLVVVGLPLNQDGTVGPQAKRTRRFARSLAARISTPIDLWDERETTIEATRELSFGGRPLDRRERGLIDSRSAAIILERYLDTKKESGLATPSL